MSSSFSDFCVVGGGIVGLAAAVSLTDRGADVMCIERSGAGRGQSAGSTRQFRHVHRDPQLIALAARARRGWKEWERRSGRRLLGEEGALRVGGETDELDALRAAGVPARDLGLEEARARFPIASLTGSQTVLWDPLAGAIRARDTIGWLADHVWRGLVRADVESLTVEPGGHGVRLRTSAGDHRCARCLVCAGAGSDRLVRPVGLDLHQRRQAHLRLVFRVRTQPTRPLPCFSDRSGNAGELVYALSDLGDRYAVGLAEATTYPAVPDLATAVPANVDVSRQRDRIIAYVRAALPGLDPRPVDALLRLTTTLPDHPEDGFVIRRHGPLVALAGQNLFKFAPALGDELAAAALATSGHAAEAVGGS